MVFLKELVDRIYIISTIIVTVTLLLMTLSMAILKSPEDIKRIKKLFWITVLGLALIWLARYVIYRYS